MKTRVLIIIGIFMVIFSTNGLLYFDSSIPQTIGILIPLYVQHADASCVSDYSEPCFDRFTKHDETFTESSLRNYFADHADRVYGIYDYPNKSEDMENNFAGFPAIVCYEIIADKKPYLLMAKWVDNTISDVKNYYAPELCEVTLNPFYEENRPDSLFQKLDVPNCKWIVKNEFPTFMDIGCYPEPLGNPLRYISLSDGYDPQRLDFIQKHCEKYGPLQYAGPLRYLNATHLIDIDTCKWDARTNSGITLDRTVYPVPWMIESPLKQIKSGIPIDEIQCKNYKHVLTERHNGKPACVYYSTAEKLGWKILHADSTMTPMIFEVMKNEKIFDVEYYVKGGTVQDMVYDVDANILLVTVDAINKGSLTIHVPRNLIDAKMDYCPPRNADASDDIFFVLINGEEVSYDEISTTSEKRTLQISFLKDVSKVEIIGTCYV